MDFIFAGKSPMLKEYPMHSHGGWEVSVGLQGESKLVFEDGRVFDCGENTVSCIPPNMRHSMRSEKGCQDIFVQFFGFDGMDGKEPKVFDSKKAGQLRSVLEILYDQVHEKGADRICASLLQVVKEMVFSFQTEKSFGDGVETLLHEIETNFRDPLFSIEKTLAVSGYHPDYLRRAFRKATGKTPHEYLNACRIHATEYLLQNKNVMRLSITQIANASGFDDVAYFSRVFKRATGLTPREYANSVSGKTEE